MTDETIESTNETLDLADLKRKTPKDLLSMAEELEIENASTMRKGEMMFQILRNGQMKVGKSLVDGVLEVCKTDLVSAVTGS